MNLEGIQVGIRARTNVLLSCGNYSTIQFSSRSTVIKYGSKNLALTPDRLNKVFSSPLPYGHFLLTQFRGQQVKARAKIGIEETTRAQTASSSTLSLTSALGGGGCST